MKESSPDITPNHLQVYRDDLAEKLHDIRNDDTKEPAIAKARAEGYLQAKKEPYHPDRTGRLKTPHGHDSDEGNLYQESKDMKILERATEQAKKDVLELQQHPVIGEYFKDTEINQNVILINLVDRQNTKPTEGSDNWRLEGDYKRNAFNTLCANQEALPESFRVIGKIKLVNDSDYYEINYRRQSDGYPEDKWLLRGPKHGMM